MKKLILLTSTIFLVAGTQFILNLAPTAVITIEALSPQELDDLGWTTAPSTGLDVVGVEELVYLSGTDGDGEEVTAFSWSLTGPAGSAATLDSTTTPWTTFRPDISGDYTVSLSVTTASGVADASVVITAGTYTGVDGALQCGNCHFNTKNDWSGTGHSDFFALAIDGLKSSNYNESCISCHTVGYDTTANNDGFDDIQALLGWTFPDTLMAGNWDDIVANYPTLANKANIQCENCHGPASQHSPFDVDNKRMAVSIDEGVCGSCHEDEPYHRRNIQWKESAHALGTTFARGTRSSCASCHSGWGFIDQHQDKSIGAPDYYSEDLPAQNITCAVCHDPHKTTIEGDHQLRTIADFTLVNGVTVTRGGTGKLCMSCHQARREANEYVEGFSGGTFRGAHHSVQTDVLFGQNAFTFGQVIANSTHNAALENACASCHMYPSPAAGEPGADQIGDHTFAVTVDDGVTRVDNTAACVQCHGQLDSFADFVSRNDDDGDGTIEGVQDEVHGLLEEVAMLLPPVGSPDILAGNDPFWADPANLLYRKAFWNYLMMEEEGSFGVHNYQFSVGILKLTKLALEFGVLDAGMIMAIDDVPNDQGRQVSVMWNRFGGDGTSDTPLQDYWVWRRVDGAMGKVSQADVISSIEEVQTGESVTAKIGKMSVVMDGHLWTAVGHQPAAAMDMYSAVVPTLADSTTDGAYWSVFKVSGHAEDSQTFVVSAPDSAYSIDNLEPMTPMMQFAGVNADAANPSVAWLFDFDREEPLNADFNYFAVYRGEAMFDPATADPIATTTEPSFLDRDVEFGKTYYYTVAAFDFSGNQSEFAPMEQVAVVVGIDGTGAVPKEFALHQNYPNPFNPSTTITYDVPSTSVVRVAVFDLLGRRIQVLVDGEVAPGTHRAVFEAGDLSSGLYVVRFETPERAFERTVMLVK
ncbi:MAG: T9SS type A sorting domain-containing protein [Rhodothermia bacterium]|nr:T9SS type A sorting domain-containing protein [Rhodothermia bacterium]